MSEVRHNFRPRTVCTVCLKVNISASRQQICRVQASPATQVMLDVNYIQVYNQIIGKESAIVLAGGRRLVFILHFALVFRRIDYRV